jgi:hypothetical protein
MRAAPPVDAALDTGGRERMLTVLLHALAGAVLGGWLTLHAEWRAVSTWVAALVSSSAALATLGWWLARRTWPAAPGHLRWDGSQWCCSGSGVEMPLARVVVALDLGTWLLLRLHPADGSQLLWRAASARTARGAWHGLRVALAAHAGAPQVASDREAAP